MSNKMYRTALGKQVDMGSLLTKNETVRAVGNMGVNARGDVLNKKNATVITKATVVNTEYRKQIHNQVEDVPVGTNTTKDEAELEIEGFDTPLTAPVTDEAQEEKEKEHTPVKKSGGLASAIAKAREVEQKKNETPREKSRGKKGVKKI